MSASRLATIDRVVRRGLTAGGYPGASVVVGRKGYSVWQKGFGFLDWSKTTSVSVTESVYDLASLTKVVGTTTAIMILFDEGLVVLDAPVQSYIPEFAGGHKDSITVRDLLAHRSGLPASRDIWRIAHTPAEARRAVVEAPLACRPRVCMIYSDLGAITLGLIVESVTGMGLDEYLQARVFGPIGMTATSFRPDASLRNTIAPTELAPPRGYPLRGEVHDENAYTLGGVAGHAGMFSTAADLSMFAQMMLNGGEYAGIRIVADSTIKLFTEKRVISNRALGWAKPNGTGGSGDHLSEAAYGHTGYTGTSLWIDPKRDMFVVLLTNRVHAAKARRPAKIISDVRADLADAAAAAVTDDPALAIAMPASFRADKARGWNTAAPKRSTKASRARAAAAKKKAAVAAAKKAAARKASTKKAAAKTAAQATSSKPVAKSTAAKKTAWLAAPDDPLSRVA
ncbi:MAG TPA: serine hydrolase [Gemmatimonadaceae bacterium]|nr:serine hydrolase [Gemmatimonadaceae bacterium]